jgi:hypothetical protein
MKNDESVSVEVRASRGRRALAGVVGFAVVGGFVLGIAAPASAVNIGFPGKTCTLAAGTNGVKTTSYGAYSVVHYFGTGATLENWSFSNNATYVTNNHNWSFRTEAGGYAQGTYLSSANESCW